MRKNHPLAWILRLKSTERIDEAFDLLIFNAYIGSQFGHKMPVEESRECFKHIKKLLSSK